MKIVSRFLVVSLFLFHISFFSLTLPQKANSHPHMLIFGALINGTLVEIDCGDTIRAYAGDNIYFSVEAFTSEFPFIIQLDLYNGTPPGPYTFNPPLPNNGLNSVGSSYSCPSAPVYDGEISFIATDALGPDFCSVYFQITSPLPVELSSFTSSVNINNVRLNWVTATENNNSGFDIERTEVKSSELYAWEKISFVPGEGSTTQPINYEYADRNLSSGKYRYRLKQLDFNGNHEYYELSNDVLIASPDKYSLSQNYPNPFNPSTTINFTIVKSGLVTIKIFDAAGKEVITALNQFKNIGYYTIDFNGGDFSSGTYYYQLRSGDFLETKKMILLK